MFRNIVTNAFGTGTERRARLDLILTCIACLAADAIVGLAIISVARLVAS